MAMLDFGINYSVKALHLNCYFSCACSSFVYFLWGNLIEKMVVASQSNTFLLLSLLCCQVWVLGWNFFTSNVITSAERKKKKK